MESVTWRKRSVEGMRVDVEGAVNSEERRRPKKAEVTAAHSMRASRGGKMLVDERAEDEKMGERYR